MRYIALLRAINVGGSSTIKMAELRALGEDLGFSGVTTLLQSGNLTFEAREAALDADSALVIALGLVAAVGGIEPDHLAFAAIGLERRFLIVDQCDHNLAVAGAVDLANESEVAVEDAFFNH